MAIYQPGDIVAGRYRVSEALSQGGMGAVYLGEQLSLGRRVAIKVILAHHQESDALRARFDAEARAVCQLHHPNIITYHDYGHDDHGRPFLVMEFLAGYPGTELVYGASIPAIDDCVHVVGQLASALHEAHGRGIIHRDLKWSNAMIVPQSHDALFTKLIDFGILKVAMDGSSGDQRKELTRTGVLLGTPQYMSPEAICGKPIDGRADQYSLAVMTYEILTGRRPFEAESRLELLRQHVQEPPPPMDDVGPQRVHHRELEAVVLRGMAKKPRDRFDSIIAFHAALCVAAGLEPPAVSGGARRPSRRVRARDAATPVARPGAGHVAIAGRTDPRGAAPGTPALGVSTASRASQTGLAAGRTPIGAPIDTAADTGSRSRPRGAPAWVKWALGATLMAALGFGGVLVLTQVLAGGEEPVPVAAPATPTPGVDERRATGPGGADEAVAGIVAGEAAPDQGAADRGAGATAGGDGDGAGERPEPAAAVEHAGAKPPVVAGEPTAAGDPRAPPPDDEASARPTADEVATVEVAAVEVAAAEVVAAPAPAPVARRVATRRSGRLTVSATPYAEVQIAGEAAGTTPITAREVRAGRVKVVLSHPTYGTRTRTVTVKPDQNAKLHVDMRR